MAVLVLRRSTGARKGTGAMTCGSGALFYPVIPMSYLPCEELHAGFIRNLPTTCVLVLIKVRRGVLRRVETVGDLSDKDGFLSSCCSQR